MPSSKRRGAHPDEIAEFQRIVRMYAYSGYPTLALPLDMLVRIADALDWVRRRGRPPETRVKRIRQMFLWAARFQVAKLKSAGCEPGVAVARVAKELQRDNPYFKDLKLVTIKDLMGRRRSRAAKESKSSSGK